MNTPHLKCHSLVVQIWFVLPPNVPTSSLGLSITVLKYFIHHETDCYIADLPVRMAAHLPPTCLWLQRSTVRRLDVGRAYFESKSDLTMKFW